MNIDPVKTQQNVSPVKVKASDKKGKAPGNVSEPTSSDHVIKEDQVAITEEGRNLQEVMEGSKKEAETVKKEEVKPVGSLLVNSKRNYDYYINDNEEVAIKVIDKESGEVIREIPDEEKQKINAALKKALETQFDI